MLKNISDQQFQYLQLISRTENITVGDIAQYFQVTSPTATSLIKKLEETGFIKKNVNSNDKRSIILTLTPKGKKALDVHKAAFDNIAKDITKALQPAELKQYQNFILKLNKQLTEN
ncbi:MAG: MarR family transcriptional regulator [Leptospiraceae bacterium]|nr:MarR family transcriptional regulator [Leptospiraceae bacterium]MCP5510545.1 MarR family transcriptional regulator [Leptospiraceae bacterium]